MKVDGRLASTGDAGQLAVMNQALIRDEGHRNAMSLHELEERMKQWLSGEYTAVIFTTEGETVGYALYRQETEWTYLRQFFIRTELRRQGLGRAAMGWLIANPWQGASRIRLDVLMSNTDGIAFWRSVGFHDYCLTMEMNFGGGTCEAT